MTSRETHKGKSTVGRPRIVSDARIAAILDWYRNRKSFKQVAHEEGISVSTLKRIIDTHGEYKQCSPDQRINVKAERRRRIAELKARYLL